MDPFGHLEPENSHVQEILKAQSYESYVHVADLFDVWTNRLINRPAGPIRC